MAGFDIPNHWVEVLARRLHFRISAAGMPHVSRADQETAADDDWHGRTLNAAGRPARGEGDRELFRAQALELLGHLAAIGALANSEEVVQGRAAVKILSDLDRCPHGRHRGDVCAGWEPMRPESGCRGGVSLGNPHLPDPGETVGYDLGGGRYVVPVVRPCGDPENWRP